jgi:glycosyltransferase involved in cell wall biosynthesis
MTSLRSDHILPPRIPRKSGPVHLLFVGRIEERKGVQDLLAAVSLLKQWEMPFTLTLVGHCYDTPSFMRQLHASVVPYVRFVDAVSAFEDLVPFYHAADVFVFPSHDEGFPRVLYEAMAFGLPILTTFVGSIPSVMQDRLNCLQIEVRNPADMARKIQDLYSNPELQAQIAKAGNQCIVKLMKSWQRSHAMQVAERLRNGT